MKVALLMVKNGKQRVFPINGKAVIGRRDDCDLRVPTADVSRRHCEVQVNGEQARMVDLGSSNGTFVNGKRVAEAALKAGDRLTVGPVTFFVQFDGKPATAPPESPPRGSKAAQPSAETEIDDILDLDELDLDEDPLSAVEAMLDEDEDEDDRPKKK